MTWPSLPAVFPDGRVCISILHAPGYDPLNPQESAAERWSPVHTVRWSLSGMGVGVDAGGLSFAQAARRRRPFPLSNALDRGSNPRSPQVESIVLSIISMLSSPNDESPANIDAAKEWRENRAEFKKKVARIVRRSQEEM